jgi:DNA-binding response OmpR family regulator
MKTILIIEDDRPLASGLALALKSQKFNIIQSFDGEDGLHKAKTLPNDLIVLDIMMPHMNGFEVITELRRLGYNQPLLILSARGASHDKVRGLDLGANDYLTKPFDLPEFLARVRRLLSIAPMSQCKLGPLTFDFEKQILVNEKNIRVPLTPKELRLLEFFLKRNERIVSRDSILTAVWGDDYDGTDRTVDNLIVNLRKKIGDAHLETIRGQGYRFVIKP